MIRRAIISGILAVLLFVCQTAVFGQLDTVGAGPNLMMIITVSFAMLRGNKSGMFTGFFCGLLTDIYSTGPVGFYALLYMYAGYICGRVHRKFYPENLMIPLGMIALADVLVNVACYLILFLSRGRYNVPFYLFRVILPEAVYTLIAAMLVYPFILWLNTWLEDLEQRSLRKFV